MRLEMNRPQVSIVIPTYNQNPEFLRAAVASALSQTYEKFELIVSNNHSTNDTLQVLSEFVDKRLKVVCPKNHLPMTENFAFAADQASGEFISFLASDDWVHPSWLQDLMPILSAHPEAVFGFGEIADVAYDDLQKINFLYRDSAMATSFYATEELLPIMFRFNRQSSWMVGDVIRADAYRKAGGIGYGGFKYSSDWGLVARLLELGGGVYLNQVVAKYRSWGHAEGKVDSLRFSGAVQDVARAYAMLDESVILRPLLANLQDQLGRAKRAKARTLLLGLLEAMAISNLNETALQDVKDHLRGLDASWTMRACLAACRRPIAPLFQILYPFGRAAYRSPLGLRLRGRKQTAGLGG
jgi:GT2 family glycosyltransferase